MAIQYLIGLLAAAVAQASPTFQKDVLPILQAHCQSCHRIGEVAPMPLMSYQDVRPWAKSVKAAVVSRQMPPWSADPSIGHFRNDPSLSADQIQTIRAWVDAGSPEGDPKSAPPPRKFVDGWNIGVPDVVFEMPQPYKVPTSGTVEYTYVILPTGFTTDTWISAAEVRPGNRAAVHHIAVFVRTANSKWLREYPLGIPFVPKPRPGKNRRSSDGDRTIEGTADDEWLPGYAPGSPPAILKPGDAMLIPANSDLVMQLHYTTNGKAASDQSKVGFIFAKQPPKRRIVTGVAGNGAFVIPPGASDHPVEGAAITKVQMELISMNPHMHLRGKRARFRAVYPTGEVEELLNVPRYDFNWQHEYELITPKPLPVGTRLEVIGAFDNSANNPHNPDPGAEVRWGDQSWEEMFVGFFGFAIDPNLRTPLKEILPEIVQPKANPETARR